MGRIAAIAVILLLSIPCAVAVETTHIFGFTAGSDVGDDPEVELESTARLGKRDGDYSALFSTLEARSTPIKNLRIGPTLTFSRHSISGVTGLADIEQATLHGASFKVKYRLMEREQAAFGLTLVTEPSWSRADDTGGQRVRQFGNTFALLMDREVAPNWFAAFNLIYDFASARSQANAEWEREARFGIAAAVSNQFRHGWFGGVELRYFRKYESFDLSRFVGHGLFIGPTWFVSLPNRWWASGAWNAQIAGRATDAGGRLDLANFVRHYVLFRVGVDF
jgi:hypothetical protein